MPDLDGECRGTPIQSLVEGQAWHPILLGVRPNDDVDRGPIRIDESGTCFDFAPFGEFANIQGSPSTGASPSTPGLYPIPDVSFPVNFCSTSHSGCARKTGQIRGSRTASVHFCRWQI